MLWWSDALGPDKRPAVLALGAKRVRDVLRCENVYVGAQLEAGTLPGRLVLTERGIPIPLALKWPVMPWGDRHGRLHPSIGWTPAEFITSLDGVDYVDLKIVEARSE